jgi:hypothetical protein
VALEKERKLSLQIIARDQERSERRFEFGVSKELRERRFQRVWRVFRQKDLAFGREDILPEDCGTILNVEIEKLIRGIRAIVFAACADSQCDDAARRSSCDQVERFE